MQANAASRICWYSTSVSVWAGATVIESPVCTPIGSTFSIEQMITQLSARSRITSSSNSFQPAIALSMRISLIGLASRPSAATRSNSSSVEAMPVPRPPRMYAGRMITGRPISLDDRRASSIVWAMPLAGTSRPISIIACLNCSRSSAVAMASALAPIISGVPGTPIEAALVQRHRHVEAGLAAERRQHRVGPLALDDLGDDLGRDRLDVGRVGEVGVGHDRRRVGVDEDDAVALLAQHPAGLGAGVVELAGLADDDRAGADDEDRVESVRLGISDARIHQLGEHARTGTGSRAARGRPRGGTAR